MNKKEIVNSSIYDADYYLAEGYGGDDNVFLENLNNYEYLYNYPLELAKIKPGEKILDLGCGIGKLAYKAVKKGCFVTGIDYSEDAINIANKIKMKLPVNEQNMLYFSNKDALDISIDNKFDVIFMTDIIEHLYDWQLRNLFKKIESILSKDSGRIIIHTAPNFLTIRFLYPLKRFLNFPSTIRKKKGFFYKRSKYFYDPAMHINEQTIWSLKKHLRSFDSRVWSEDFSKNIISLISKKILGNHIWAFAKLK